VTVFRDGVNAGLFATAQTDMKQLVAAIVGPGHALAKAGGAEAPAPSAPMRETVAPDAAILTLSDVSNDRLHHVDLALRQGEIHGLAGLVGSGRTEILQTIFGLRAVDSGGVAIAGKSLTNGAPAQAIELGLALVPEDRHVQGLILEHSIERNLTLPQLPHFSRWGWLQQRASQQQAQAAMSKLSIKAPGPATYVKNLSGGNQQKVVFAKWSHPRPRVLLLDEPTVGVDVGAREEIYGLIRGAANEGTGVLLVSSDLAELISLCDRISIVVDGRVLKTLNRGDLGNAEELHHLIQLSQFSEASAA
jgi:ribose transport system ATP-binding protein